MNDNKPKIAAKSAVYTSLVKAFFKYKLTRFMSRTTKGAKLVLLIFFQASLLAGFGMQIKNNIVNVMFTCGHGNSKLSQIVCRHYYTIAVDDGRIKFIQCNKRVRNGE